MGLILEFADWVLAESPEEGLKVMENVYHGVWIVTKILL